MSRFLFGRKHLIRLTIVLAVCCISALFIAGCSPSANSPFADKSFIDDDYVEVTGIRADKTDIKMSTTGEPSTFQLKVSILPENATNQALKYYISSEYHKYLTVSNTGLLTAHTVTNGQAIPVIISSTTNPNAKLTMTVIIEDVSVETLRFTSDKLNLWYEGASGKVSIVYLPSHAIDGRNAYFTSLNPDIATVAPDGTVTPIAAGNTTIKATCETRTGKIIEAFTSVVVSYAKGEYQLDVSGTANFNQVINNYSPIDFTLLILGENVDPNPRIEWFVDTERVPTNSDMTQYSHIPMATSPMSYKIYVKVTPYGGDTVTIESKPINVHKAFNGITLRYDNLSTVYDAHRYGDVYSFELNEGDTSSQIVKYKWYLSEQSDPQHTVFVGETTPQSKNLTRRLNIAGDYVLIAHAVDINDSVISHSAPFTFSCERLIEGDTLVATPELLEHGLPADSYHWYKVNCDENGNFVESQKIFIQDTAADETFYFPLEKGNFRLLVTATINGVGATVYENGAQVPYTYVSDVIRVYDDAPIESIKDYDLIDCNDKSLSRYVTEDFTSINEIKTEGLYYNNDYAVFLRWNTTSGNDSYIVEITREDGSVAILDSKNPNGSIMGGNFCIINQNIITLDDVFSVRIKKKNGLFSEKFHYGKTNDLGVADKTHVLSYPITVHNYFDTISYNNTSIPFSVSDSTMKRPLFNTYVYDMEDLREIAEFILLYKPSSNKIIKRTAVDSSYLYTIDLYIPFDYTDELETLYPVSVDRYKLESYGLNANVYLMIKAATEKSPYAFNYDLIINGADGKYTVSFVVDAKKTSLTFSQPTSKPEIGSNFNYTTTPDSNVSYFPIDGRDSIFVYDSDQLLFAMQNGFAPLPSGNDNLSALYKKIKTIVSTITHTAMSDKEKLLAFYDYLALNMVYDSNLEKETEGMSEHQIYLYESFHLEGAFNSKTVVDLGMAKALTAMCGVVNIPCIIVEGTLGRDKTPIVWNKVYIDGKWYVVDAMRAVQSVKAQNPITEHTVKVSAVDYSFFMLNDKEYENRLGETVSELYSVPVATTTLTEKDCIYYADTSDELINVLETLNISGSYSINFTLDTYSFGYDAKDILSELNKLNNERFIFSDVVYLCLEDDYIRVIISVTTQSIN